MMMEASGNAGSGGMETSAAIKPRVLIVDDEESIRICLRAFLLRDGYEVETVSNAHTCLALIQESEYDAVISDISLPDINGIELLEAIRRASPFVQVIMLTGMPTVKTAAAALRAGAFDYLTKPVEKNAVLRVVGNAVRIRRVEAERKRLAAANDAYRRELEAMVASLKHEIERRSVAEGAKDDFLNMVSHDLRTPLAISKEAIGLLLEAKPELSDEQKGIVEIVTRNMDRLSSLVDDLLDVSLLDAGKLTLEPKSFGLVDLTQQVCSMLQSTAAKKGLTLSLQSESSEIEILADRDRILQVLTNFGTNAIKYTQKGSVTFVLRVEGTEVIIDVVDTGVGIPKEELAGMFEKFQKTTATRKTGQKGIGLGLFITRNLVELHGGKVSVMSEEGKGSVFTARLPLKAKTS
jgi:signal transduction histidine kinase